MHQDPSLLTATFSSQTAANAVAMETDAVVMQSVSDRDMERLYYYTPGESVQLF